MIGEYHDGGYWVVVPVVIDAEGGKSAGEIPGRGYSLFYGEDYGIYPDLVAVRTPDPVDVPQALEGFTVSDLLGEIGLDAVPYGRTDGN